VKRLELTVPLSGTFGVLGEESSEPGSQTTPAWVSVGAGPGLRYSDHDSETMRRKRVRDVIFGLAMSLLMLGILSLNSVVLAVSWGGSLDRMAAVLGLWALTIIFASWGLHYALIRGPRDALRCGYFLTDEVLHFNGVTIPVSSILGAELVTFYGYRGRYLAIDHERTTLGRKWVGTSLIGSEDTASIETLRDAIRSVKGWPLQVLETRTTWGEWRKAAKRIWKEASP